MRSNFVCCVTRSIWFFSHNNGIHLSCSHSMTMIIVIVLYIRFTGGWLAFFTPGDVVVVGYGCQFAPISLSHSHKYTNELNVLNSLNNSPSKCTINFPQRINYVWFWKEQNYSLQKFMQIRWAFYRADVRSLLMSWVVVKLWSRSIDWFSTASDQAENFVTGGRRYLIGSSASD